MLVPIFEDFKFYQSINPPAFPPLAGPGPVFLYSAMRGDPSEKHYNLRQKRPELLIIPLATPPEHGPKAFSLTP